MEPVLVENMYRKLCNEERRNMDTLMEDVASLPINTSIYEIGRNLVLDLKEGEEISLYGLADKLYPYITYQPIGTINYTKRISSRILASLKRGGYITLSEKVKGKYGGKKIAVYKRTYKYKHSSSDKKSLIHKKEFGSQVAESLDGEDEQTVKKAKGNIIEVNKISILELGKAEEAIKASLRVEIRKHKEKHKELKKEYDEIKDVNVMLQRKIAECQERICELEGNRAALAISSKSIAEVKDHISHP